ncbi:MAG: transglutaminase domain-containing protein [Clostridiales Family XIII bacterium]|jgi:hypothetical protein|nr:transglutaminase domain-containing protein [Clostridiales Family XIII bacterium]
MKKMERLWAILLSIAVIVGATACGGASPGAAVGSSTDIGEGGVRASDYAAEVAAKYAENDAYEYLPAIPPVARDHQFEFTLGFYPPDLGFEDYTDVLAFFADPEFTVPIYTNWDSGTRDDGTYGFTAMPWRNPTMGIWNRLYANLTDPQLMLDKSTLSDDPEDEYYFQYKGEFLDWGNLPRYYMVQYLDFETGEPLAKPKVQVFEVKAELATPEATFFVDDDGNASFRWKPVEGADSYIVVSCALSDGGETNPLTGEPMAPRYSEANVIGMVDGDQTEWHTASNYPFQSAVNIAEGGYVPEGAELEEGQETYESSSERGRTTMFGVIAIGEGGHSNIGKLFKLEDLAPNLPFGVAWETKRAEGETSSVLPSIGLLPAQRPYIMCDGHIVYKTIAYDYDTAEVVTEEWLQYDEGPDGEILNPRKIDATVLKIYYSIPGTGFPGKDDFNNYYKIENPPENWKGELKKIKARQEALNRGSGTGNEIDLTDGREGEGEEGTEPASDVTIVPEEVFATNGLSEYLAVNMIAGVDAIPLDDFPQASDTEYLLDAFFEAYYQNPLILGVDGLALNKKGELVVGYQETGKERKAKQDAIRAKVAEVIPQIIEDGMTPLEKELAINQYLCDNGEYDFAALEDAEKNNYTYVDPKFNDSFNAYGILVDGVGVCSSYAASFKLLADAAGLDSIVSTGFLEGSVAHAWNRVNLNGEWQTVDVTNNDNPELYNVLLNLPDDVAAGALVEDKDFILDAHLAEYAATGDTDEYYHVEGKYYSEGEIVAELVSELQSNGSAMLRTDYGIDDYAFASIVTEVMEELGTDELWGGYWLGVIALSKNG